MSNSQMPPGQVVMLIQISCYVYLADVNALNDSPAANEFVKRLFAAELIENDTWYYPGKQDKPRNPYNATARGYALINKWCNTPLPILEEKWI